MSAHTPGPWEVVNHPRVAHVDSMRSVGHGANGMASIVWLTGGALAQEANARLIAAAPDLLAALKRLLLAPTGGKEKHEAVAGAHVAIAKAEGREPPRKPTEQERLDEAKAKHEDAMLERRRGL